jgi:hypothetical protein
VLLQSPVAAAPPAPTVTVTEVPGVNERVPKETPPPPAPAPKLTEQTPRFPPPPPPTTNTSAEVTPVGTVHAQADPDKNVSVVNPPELMTVGEQVVNAALKVKVAVDVPEVFVAVIV